MIRSSGSALRTLPLLLLLLTTAAVAHAIEYHPGVPAGAAALFHDTDEALLGGDLGRFGARFDDDFLGLPRERGKKASLALAGWVIRKSPTTFETVILGGGRLGDLALVSVDHRLVFAGSERVLHKVYLLRPGDEGYRIVALVDTTEGDRYEMAGARVDALHMEMHLRPPEGWILFRVSTGMYLEEVLLLSPGLDTWVTLGLVDTGGHGAREEARRETGLLAAMTPGLEVLEEGDVRFGGLPGWRTRIRFPPRKGDGAKVAERVHLVRDELAWVVWCRSTRLDPSYACEEVLDPMLSSLRQDSLPRHSLKHFLKDHGNGQVHGGRYESQDPPVQFTAPRGWKSRVRGTALPYLVGMRSPSGKLELMAGALPLRGDAERSVRGIVRMTSGGGEPDLIPLEVTGSPGWKATQRFGETEHRIVFVPRGEILHFFSIRPAEPEGDEVLDAFLRGVSFTAP